MLVCDLRINQKNLQICDRRIGPIICGFVICGLLKGLLASVNYIYSNSANVLINAQIIGHSTFGWQKNKRLSWATKICPSCCCDFQLRRFPFHRVFFICKAWVLNVLLQRSAETFTLRNIFQRVFHSGEAYSAEWNTQTNLAGFDCILYFIVWFPCFREGIRLNSCSVNRKTNA